MALLFAVSATLACIENPARAAGTWAEVREGGGAAVAVSEHLRASLLVDPPREGSSVGARVGVLFDLAPGWHLYWRNPGDTGLPPELHWTADGGTVGSIQWPAPKPFDSFGTGFSSYGYSDQVLLLSDLAGHESVEALRVEGQVLICENECIPIDFDLMRSRPGPGEEGEEEKQEARLAEVRALFDRYAERVPVSPDSLSVALGAHYSRTALGPGDEFEGTITIESCSAVQPGCNPISVSGPNAFIPELATDEALDFEFLPPVPHGELANLVTLPFRGTVEADIEHPPTRLTGILRVRNRAGEIRGLKLDLPFPGAPASASNDSSITTPITPQTAEPESETRGASLLRVMLLALLGGLILNGMPCVLPVLGIKVCAAAELAQHDPGELRRHGFAYLAGVSASMATLAAIVVSLKAAGTRVGWGFQFQEPLFVAVVATIVVLFALNLFGVFEVELGASRLSEVGGNAPGPRRSFFDGLLAVVLATPCTAPFLGTAVGFAFAGSSLMIFATFLAIGFGLAAPYTLVSLIPGWSRFVPRPGGWMLRMRAGLGFLLLATAVWLIWIFGRSAGADGQASLLAMLVALSFGTWLLGWIQSHARTSWSLAAVCTLFALCALGLSRIDIEAQAYSQGSTQGAEAAGEWARFDPAAINASLAAGRPVFVSFTADWCITCKVNERRVLADARVHAALEQRGFSAFRGDWTRRDERIRVELARHGRAGVPLYLVYDPRDPEHPTVLPELLSVEVVLTALGRVSPSDQIAVQSEAWRSNPSGSR